MMIVMKEAASEEEIEAVISKIERAGARAHASRGQRVTVIGAIGDVEQDESVASLGLEGQPGVDRVVPILKPYKLASSQFRHGEPSVLEIGGRKIGGDHFALIAGPCTVESREQVLQSAEVVKAAGASMLRGGAYKPRTSPYSFQGLGQEGLELLAEAKAQTGLPIVTELMDARDLPAVLEVADVIQLGARNMQNFPLLAEVGRAGRPVLLKRGLAATLEELLMAAEYILKEGNPNVMLCERGIRTFETAYRTTLDLQAVPVLKEMTHLPVIVDPSHAAGRRALVRSMSLAAAAAGADGIIVEVHPNPDEALCDGPQALPTDTFAEYADVVYQVAALAGKRPGHVQASAPLAGAAG
jgi:3-deoxy-7-phosphoheptulonate synthase